MTATLITTNGTVTLEGAASAIAYRLQDLNRRLAKVHCGQVTFHVIGAEAKADVLEKNV